MITQACRYLCMYWFAWRIFAKVPESGMLCIQGRSLLCLSGPRALCLKSIKNNWRHKTKNWLCQELSIPAVKPGEMTVHERENMALLPAVLTQESQELKFHFALLRRYRNWNYRGAVPCIIMRSWWRMLG